MEIEETIKRIRQNTTQETTSKYGCNLCKDEGWIGYTGADGHFYCRECECGLIQKKKINGHLAFASIPERYKNLRFVDFEVKWYAGLDVDTAEKDLKVCRYYVQNYLSVPPGRGLYLFSSTKGTGKTRMVSIIANELVRKGIEVKFATSGQILDEIKKTWNNESDYSESSLMNDLVKADILIIDDFGVDAAKDWRNEKFYNIINSRYISMRPTIYTSNYNLEDLERIGYDGRIISRIRESCYLVPFPGESVREAKSKENQMEMKSWMRVGK